MSKSNMNLKLVAGLLVATGSTTALASMNNLNVQSHLGERFSASIVVTGPTAQEILQSPSSVSVSGAPVSARVSKKGATAVIHLRSSAPINDPVIRLVVQAGTESRHYSAIIDPKDDIHQSAQVNSAKAIPAEPVVAADNKQVTTDTATAKTTTAQTESKTESQTAPAQTATSDKTTAKAEPAQATKAKAAVAKPRVIKRTIQNNRDRQKQVRIPAAANVAAAENYVVQPNDSIFEIASRFQPQGLNTAQTAKALMHANPQAFRNGNANLLYGDVTLKIPSAEDMHLLATGRSPKNIDAPSNTTVAKAATAVTTTAAVTPSITPPVLENTNDIDAIEKQLAQLESQKDQLEKQLAKAEAQKQADAKKQVQDAKKAEEKPVAIVTPPEAKVVASEPAKTTANIVAASEPKTASETVTMVSEPVMASEPIIASEAVAASEPAASAVVAAPVKPTKTKPIPPPVENEPSLMDLIMQNLPYLAGGVVGLLLLALLLKKARQKKASGNDDGPPNGNANDDDISFDFDDSALNKDDDIKSDGDDNNLTAAELAALTALDTFQPENETALRQTTAQPTLAPTLNKADDTEMTVPKEENLFSRGSALVSSAALATSAAVLAKSQDKPADADFMLSEEELAQFAQPAATAAPELDDFNLDDLDDLLKSTQSPISQNQAVDLSKNDASDDVNLGDFDLNELDSLLQQNGFGEQTPAPIHSFTKKQADADDFDLDFDVDAAVQNTQSISAPAADQSSNRNSQSLDDLDDLLGESVTAKTKDSDLDLSGLDFLSKTTPQQNNLEASDFDLDLGDLDFDAKPNVAATAAVGLAAAAAVTTTALTSSPAEDGLTLSQEDINDINFDVFNLDSDSNTPTIESKPSASIDDLAFDLDLPATNTSMASAAESDFALNLDDLLSTDASAKTSESSDTTLAMNELDLPSFDLNVADTSVAPIPTASIDALLESASKETVESETGFVGKFASISDDPDNNKLAFDDSFSGLNFDDLLQIDQASSGSDTDNAASNSDLDLSIFDSEFTPTVEPTTAPIESTSKFKDFSIDTAATAERPAQAWAGTGSFGLHSDDANAAIDSQEPSFAFDSLNLDGASAEVTMAATSVPEISIDTLAVDALTAQTSAPESMAMADLDLNNFDLDESILEVNLASTAAPLQGFDSNELAVDMDAFDLSLDVPAELASDATHVDLPTESVVINDLGFDLILDDAMLDDSMADVEPSIQPAPTATPDIVVDQFDFQLDDAPLVPQATISTPEPEISESLSLDDFDISFNAIPSAIDEGLSHTADLHLNEALGVKVTQAPLTIDDLDFDFDAPTDYPEDSFSDSVFEDEAAPAVTMAATEAPNMVFEAPLPTPHEAAPLALIETAPPIVDTNAYLNNMDHTYATKWDLAQMYLDLGDQESTREILIDLMENGSETYSQRAQALYNNLS